jgi:hypothetical protein
MGTGALVNILKLCHSASETNGEGEDCNRTKEETEEVRKPACLELYRKGFFQNLLEFCIDTQLCIPDYTKLGREISDFSKPRGTPLHASQGYYPQLVPTRKYFVPSNTEDSNLLERTLISSGRKSSKSETHPHLTL